MGLREQRWNPTTEHHVSRLFLDLTHPALRDLPESRQGGTNVSLGCYGHAALEYEFCEPLFARESFNPLNYLTNVLRIRYRGMNSSSGRNECPAYLTTCSSDVAAA